MKLKKNAISAHRHDKEVSSRAREKRGRNQQNRWWVTIQENSYEFSTKHGNRYIKFSHTSCCIITRRKFWEGPCNLDYTVALEKTFPSLLLTTYRATSQPLFNFATTTLAPSLHLGAAAADCRASSDKSTPDEVIIRKRPGNLRSLKKLFIKFLFYNILCKHVIPYFPEVLSETKKFPCL